MKAGPPWLVGSRLGAVERPEAVDEAIDRNDAYVGVTLPALVRGHPDSAVVLPRIKKAPASRSLAARAVSTRACTRARWSPRHRAVRRGLHARLHKGLSTPNW
ncbi:hypothetical protein [Catenuloplanes japonicus]|uniref:hypothetical protein n=1 Tax=Catenuloplanes japonicus TaxID=33876 RepID=UPI0005260F2E|nr:hypothetical protein [Catenuloplanes japonicus]